MTNGSDATIGYRDHVSQAVEQMTQPLAIFDRELRLVFVNRAATDLLRLPGKLARPGTPMKEFVFHQGKQGAYDLGDFDREFERRVRTPRLRFEFTTDDGTTIRVQRDPLENGGSVVLYTDVSEQRRAEAALQRSEERYRTIVEDQTELILRCTPEGTITFVNAACCQFHGADRMDLVGRPVLDLVHEEDRGRVAAFFTRDARHNHMREIEHRALRGDGEVRYLHRRDRIISNRHGEAIEVQSVLSDVTDIRAAEAQVHRFSSLAILGQVSAGVTHELNQPLNAASMGVQNILMQLDGDTTPRTVAVRAKIGKVLDRLDRMGQIINHLRSFIQPTGRGHVCADLAGVIDISIDLFRHQLVIDEIDVRVTAPPLSPPVLGDKVQLEIIFTNLLTNAQTSILERRREAGEKTGPWERGRIEVSVHPHPTSVEVRIADNGGGIPDDTIKRIFEPFFTTHEVGGGMGLGLSLVYRIVAGLNGTITARNLPDGAEFRVLLPIATEEDWP